MPRTLSAYLLGMLLVLALSAKALPQDVSEADKARFQDIIASQIEAFRADDGARAFSFASPTIKSKFRNPDFFMAMVRSGYPAVYRPQSVRFGEVTRDLGAPTQKVHLIGPKGGAWTALYAMQRQDDGTWKISGVVMVKEEGAGA